MPTLLVANIQTGSATTDLTLRTGNTSGPSVILYSNNSGIAITSNSTNVLLSINATSNVFLGGVAVGGISSNVTTANVSGTGQLITSGNVTPTIITSNTTAWNPDSTDIATVIRVQANAAGTANNTNLYEAYISGFSAGTNGQIYTISNIGSQKIQLKNEDSINESTAANRFKLPSNIWLYGYQSIQMIYDGTLARWKPLTLLGASPALSLGYDYENTVTLRFNYKNLDKGYFVGGSAPGAPSQVTTADRTTFASETTAAVTGANLSQARGQFRSAGNNDKGISPCGANTTSSYSVTSDKTTISSETTASTPSTTLSTAKQLHGAIGNIDKGFFSGGITPAVGNPGPGTTDKCTYSTDTTAIVSGGGISQARQQLAGLTGNPDKGFFSGGWATIGVVTTTDRTTYSTETNAAVSAANLPTAVQEATAIGNADKGFVSGGNFPSITTANRINHSTETLATVTGANLSQARGSSAGIGDSNKGFFVGGSVPSPGTVVTTADKTTYSTETTTAVTGANLTQARSHGGSF